MILDEYCDWLKRFDPRLHEIYYIDGTLPVRQKVTLYSYDEFNDYRLAVREKATPPSAIPPRLIPYQGANVHVWLDQNTTRVIGMLKGDRVVMDGEA